MRRLKVVVLAVLVLGLCSFTLLGKHQGPRRFENAHVYEPVIRGEARNSPMPVYPEEAINAGAQGLVDIAVVFDEDGKTKRIKILESPHPAISKAVEDAVNQWIVRVSYSPEGVPARLFGELRFHFVIKDGVASVENPSREEQEIRSRAFLKVLSEEHAKLRSRP
jgi:TonB family protein